MTGIFKNLDEVVEGEEELLWCLRGYPFMCPNALSFEVIDLYDPDLLSLLDMICSICLERLEYERLNRGFAV